ncbi:MAG: thioredoxin-dependent thiol peroxidase [Phycisphaerae bacterium]
MALEVGKPAPLFDLASTTGESIALKNLKGKKVVLYFYPKDDTPGCTKEACNFRDAIGDLKKAGAVVLGVSPDDVASHAKFSAKFGLNFPLLADVDHALAEAYGVWKEKSMYGKTYMGVERTTFLIDSKGNLAKISPKVKVDEHHTEVLAAVAELE